MGRPGRSFWNSSRVLHVHRKGKWRWVGFGGKVGYVVLDGGKNWLINFDTRSSQVKIDRGGFLSSQILASPSNEKGNSNNLTVVLGTFGCLKVDVTLLKKRRWLCGSCLLVKWFD
nr:hypothetical protein [Tanacetum cinerariifolium]